MLFNLIFFVTITGRPLERVVSQIPVVNDWMSNVENWTVAQLKGFSLVRDVPISNPRKNILVKSCYAAHLLGFNLKIIIQS